MVYPFGSGHYLLCVSVLTELHTSLRVGHILTCSDVCHMERGKEEVSSSNVDKLDVCNH